MFFKKILTRAFKECGYYKEISNESDIPKYRPKCKPLEIILGSWMEPSLLTLPLYAIAIPMLYIGASFLDYLNKEFKKPTKGVKKW